VPEWFDVNAAIDGLGGASVHVLGAKREDEVRRVLTSARFGLRTLEGGLVLSGPSFFREVARALAFPEHFGHNWDALQDLLGDLTEGAERRIALLWREADRSFEADPQTVVDAFVSFSRAAEDLASETPPTQLEVFLLGDRPGFGRLRR
jgi:RNAse (barnase) inhibitor barstar